MQADVILTVAESKRLIAQGVVALPSVQTATRDGLIVISTGTTNAYVAEEILKKPIDKAGYITGRVMPANLNARGLFPERAADIVLRNGEIAPELDRYSGVCQFKPGDVFIKGANALNYQQQVAGITVGAGDGGTIGGVIGKIIAGRATLVIPVGLEKLVAHDIQASYRKYASGDATLNSMCALWPVTGTIITEIEAIQQLVPGMEVRHVGSGGILGAEGSVRLLFAGDADSINQAISLIRAIQGEPHFLPIPSR